MKKLTKAIAMILTVTTISTAAIGAASAGGIGDFFSGLGKTVAHTIKSAYHGVTGAYEYMTTKKDADECFKDFAEEADKIGDGLKKMGKGALQTVEDVGDFNSGMIQMVTGAAATAATFVGETVVNAATGKFDYSLTKSTANYTQKGFEKMDKSVETLEEGARMTGPVGNVLTTAARVTRTAMYATVGYKNTQWSDVKKEVVDGATDVVTGFVAGTAGKMAGKVAGSVGGEVVTTAVNTGVKIAKDLTNPNDKRSTTDIILEDISTAVCKKIVTTGVKEAAKSITEKNDAPETREAPQPRQQEEERDVLNDGHIYEEGELEELMGEDDKAPDGYQDIPEQNVIAHEGEVQPDPNNTAMRFPVEA